MIHGNNAMNAHSYTPCLNCENREVGCHSKCVCYAKYKAKMDEYNAKRNEIRRQTQLVDAFSAANKANTVRGRRYDTRKYSFEVQP